MNEREKMYENAGIEPTIRNKAVGRGYYIEHLREEVYPPFTAEKQLELIKWLAKKDCMYRLTYERDFLWCSQLEWQSSFCYESFEESLANLVNAIWQDLTEEEKQQVKGILK